MKTVHNILLHDTIMLPLENHRLLQLSTVTSRKPFTLFLDAQATPTVHHNMHLMVKVPDYLVITEVSLEKDNPCGQVNLTNTNSQVDMKVCRELGQLTSSHCLTRFYPSTYHITLGEL